MTELSVVDATLSFNAAEEQWDVHKETGYEVSTLGRVRKPGGTPRKTKRIGFGYVGVNIVQNSKHQTKYVHRMVLETFRSDKYIDGYQGSHLNGDRTDNRLQNLAWESTKTNAARRREHGTSGVGEKNAMAKLKIWQALFIKQSKSASSAIAKQFGVSPNTINDIRSGKTWSTLNGAT